MFSRMASARAYKAAIKSGSAGIRGSFLRGLTFKFGKLGGEFVNLRLPLLVADLLCEIDGALHDFHRYERVSRLAVDHDRVPNIVNECDQVCRVRGVRGALHHGFIDEEEMILLNDRVANRVHGRLRLSERAQ